MSKFAPEYDLFLDGVKFGVELCVAHLRCRQVFVEWVSEEGIFELDEGRRTHTNTKASSIQHREFPPACLPEKEEAENATPGCTNQGSSTYTIEEG